MLRKNGTHFEKSLLYLIAASSMDSWRCHQSLRHYRKPDQTFHVFSWLFICGMLMNIEGKWKIPLYFIFFKVSFYVKALAAKQKV